MLRLCLKFFFTFLFLGVAAINTVASNFSRLTGHVINKPCDVVIHNEDIYLCVMNYKAKFSGEKALSTIKNYRSQFLDNQPLFDEFKRWYNMTRPPIEKR